MRPKILMTGGSGGLGREFIRQNKKFSMACPPEDQMDIIQRHEIYSGVEFFKPDIFLHCAAMSSPMKNHDENPMLSISTNIVGTANVASVCLQRHVKLVYISTDFVYPGTNGAYSESDGVFPVNHYAWSKLGGECSVQMMPADQFLIFRCAFIDKPYPHRKAITDGYKSLIYVDAAVKMMLRLIEEGATGVYNIGGERTTYFEFARKDNASIAGTKRKDLNEFMPRDVSMNCEKAKR